jgi:threonine dehydratase
MNPPTADDVRAAGRRLAGTAVCTPVLRSDALDALTGCQVFLKAEMFQRTGSFKFRGAYNAVASLSSAQRGRGVVTYSSGNHGQALACAAAMLESKATVVMPDDAPSMKIDAVRRLGAELVLYNRESGERAAIADRIADERGALMIPPFDHPAVICGQGTVALELLHEQPGLDALLVPVGGGGLLAGCAIIATSLAPGVEIVGVEPAAMPRLALSMDAGHRVTVPFVPTVADALQTTTPGELTFSINSQLADTMLAIDDITMIDAVTALFDLVKIAAEPSGASALGAVMTHRERFANRKVGVVVSGGNMGLADLIDRRASLYS